MKKFLHKRKTERKPSEEEYVIRKSMYVFFIFRKLIIDEEFFESRKFEQYVLSIIFPIGKNALKKKKRLSLLSDFGISCLLLLFTCMIFVLTI